MEINKISLIEMGNIVAGKVRALKEILGVNWGWKKVIRT